MKLSLACIAAVLAASHILAFASPAQAAGAATFSAAASPSSVIVGANTTFSLYANGSDVNVVTGTFSYDSNKLQFISSACAGSFSNTISASSASVSCYVAPGTTVSGLQRFATVTFKSVATGSAALTITGSQIASGGANIWNGVTASTSATINPEPVAPNPTAVPATPTTTPTKVASSPTVTAKPSATATPTSSPAPTEEPKVAGESVDKDAPTPTPTPTTATPTIEPAVEVKGAQNHTAWLVAAGVILLVVIGVIGYFFRSKLNFKSN